MNIRLLARAAQALVFVGLLVAGSSVAWAQSDRDRAAALSEEAAELFDGGELQEAAYRYEEAYQLAPDPSFAFNLGAIYNELGDQARTWRWFSAYIELFPGAPDRADITAFIDALEEDLPVSHTTLRVTSNARDARVAIVGRPTPDVLGHGDVETFLAPGNYEVEVTAEGYEPHLERFRASAGVVVAINASLVALPEPVVAPQAAAAPLVVEPVRHTRGAGWAMLGTGLAAGGASAVLFVGSSNARNDHNTLVAGITPDNPGDPDEIDRLESKSNALAGAGVGAAIVGAAGIGVGAWLIARDNSDTVVAFGPDGRGGWQFALGFDF